MHFILFLTFEGISFSVYGPYVENPESDRRVNYYKLVNNWDDIDLFYDDINDINNTCGALLGYGDLDYFNASKCAKLEKWIEERLHKPLVPRYKEILETLKDYCHRAVELNTGVMIDL